MNVNIVDLLVLLAVGVFAWSGWRQGFVAAFLSFVGFISGGLVGAFLAPVLLQQANLGGTGGLAITVLLVLGMAVAGQIGASIIGRSVRDRITIHQFQVLDNAGGAVLNVLALAVIGWVLAATAAALPASPIASEVRSSAVLATLDKLVPNQARDLVGNIRSLVDDSGLPQLFDRFGVLPPAPVDPPSAAVVKDPDVQRALGSVVRVEGTAQACNAGFTGSGFVVAPERIITNAHVIAGVREPRVHVPYTREVYSARAIYFDPRVDVAVLDVPGLAAAPLRLNTRIMRGDDTIIAGYPGGGPMTVTAARVRGTISSDLARGTDIYGNPGVSREIFALRGKARPGNSGGPLLNPDGRVVGVVFAQAQADPQTAYALTANQVAPAVAAARREGSEVSTGGCPKG